MGLDNHIQIVEITTGKANSQQGLAITCKDSSTKGRPEAVRVFWSDA